MSTRRPSVPSAQHYQRQQQQYYQDDPRQTVEYARSDVDMDDDDEDEDTQVQTDVSAMPAPQSAARAMFRSDPVESQEYFDASLPPDSITPAPRRLPSTQQQPPQYPSQARRGSRGDGMAPAPAPRALPPPPAAVSYAYQQPQTPVSAERYSADDRYDNGGDSGDDSDDAFTAVGTGVATDLDYEDEPIPASRAGGNVPGARERLWQQQQAQQQQQNFARPPPSPTGRMPKEVGRRPSFARERLAPQPYPDPRSDPNYVEYLRQQRQQAQSGGRGGPDNVQLAPIRSPIGSSDDDRSPRGRVGGMQRYPSASNMGQYRNSVISGVSDTSSEGTITPTMQQPPQRLPPLNKVVSKQALSSLPEDSAIERNLIRLLKSMNFSVALKDLHDTFEIGVTRTLVAEDGEGHAFVKVICKKILLAEHIEREPHLARHWFPQPRKGKEHWEFRTVSHRVPIVWVIGPPADSRTSRGGRP